MTGEPGARRSKGRLPPVLLPLPLVLWPAGCSPAAKCAADFDPPTKFTVEEVLPSVTELYRVVRTDTGEAVASMMGESLSLLSKAVSFVASDGTMLANVRQTFLSNNLEFFDCTGDKIADVVMPTSNSSPGQFLVHSDTKALVLRTVEGPWWSQQQWITVNALDATVDVNDGSKVRSPGTLLVRMSQEKSGLAHHAQVEVLASSLPNATLTAEIEASGAAGRRLPSSGGAGRVAPVDPVVMALFAIVSYSEVNVLASWRVLVLMAAAFLVGCVIFHLVWRQVGKELFCSMFAGSRFSPVQALQDEGHHLIEQPGVAVSPRQAIPSSPPTTHPTTTHLSPRSVDFRESDNNADQERRIAELRRKKEDFQRRKAELQKEERRLAEEERQREEEQRQKAAQKEYEEELRRLEERSRRGEEAPGGPGRGAEGLPRRQHQEDERTPRTQLEEARAQAEAERRSLELARGQIERERRELEEERQELARLRQEASHPAPAAPASARGRDRLESHDTVYSGKSNATAYDQNDQTAGPPMVWCIGDDDSQSQATPRLRSWTADAEDQGHFRPARASA